MGYIFTKDFLTFNNAKDANANAIGRGLEDIAKRHGGRLTPPEVVDDARGKPDHPLYPHFEWDNEAAGEKYRIDQARAIIRCVKIVGDDDRAPCPAYFSINDASGVSYRSAEDVLNSSDLQSRVLAQAERDLLAFERRYASLTEICEVIRGAREIIGKRYAKQGGEVRTS